MDVLPVQVGVYLTWQLLQLLVTLPSIWYENMLTRLLINFFLQPHEEMRPPTPVTFTNEQMQLLNKLQENRMNLDPQSQTLMQQLHAQFRAFQTYQFKLHQYNQQVLSFIFHVCVSNFLWKIFSWEYILVKNWAVHWGKVGINTCKKILFFWKNEVLFINEDIKIKCGFLIVQIVSLSYSQIISVKPVVSFNISIANIVTS